METPTKAVGRRKDRIKMDFAEFQDESNRTGSADVNLTVCALGLSGESGEVADHVKKFIAHGHKLDEKKILYELGDILWYIAQAARSLGTTIDEVATMNVKKLRERYPNGFEIERSLNRKEEL